MKKRILSVLFCLCMVMALLPTTALADESPVGIGDTWKISNINTYDGLVTALSSVATVSKGGTPEKITIRLTKDIVGRIYLNISNAYIIFDANGHTVSGTGQNEALCLENFARMTVELIGGGVYNSGNNNTIFAGSGNTLKIKSATINAGGSNLKIYHYSNVTAVKEAGYAKVGVKIGEATELTRDTEYTFNGGELSGRNRIVVRQIVTETHEHPLCGASCSHSSDTHSDVTWTGVSTLTNEMAAGNYYLTGDVTLSTTWEPGNGVNLCLNGHTIEANGEFDTITVNSSVAFTLTDCTTVGEPGKITHKGECKGRGIYNGGTFNLYGGSITDNSANTSGGGVYTTGTNATFTMSGGSITGNTASGNGGGVYATSEVAAFTMSGGNITDNTAGGNGGGVYAISAATAFTMTGGRITGNSADNGGGVYKDRGTFNMTGGDITGNEATKNGGGVYNYLENTDFIMSGGSITGNSAKYGGGVSNPSARFTMSGGSITSNTATIKGGGLYNAGGTFTVSGSVNVSGNTNGTGTGAQANNVHLGSAVITIGGALTNTTSIGVTTESTPAEGTPVAITGTNSNDFSSRFASDVAAYEPFNDGNVVKLRVKEVPVAYTVTKDSTTNGSFTVSHARAAEGTTVTITASPDSGYEVGNVTVIDTDNGSVSVSGTGNTRTFTMPAKNVTVTVTFREITHTTYTVTFQGGEGALGTPPQQTATAAGGTFTLPANTFTKAGYTFAGWNDGTRTYQAGNTYIMPGRDVTFTAQWTYIDDTDNDDDDADYTPSYKVETSVSKDADGTVSVKPSTAEQGDKVTITVTPDRYYNVDGVTVKDQNGKKITVTENADGTFTFKMPASKVTVEPVFSWDNPFADVAENAYYASAVEWALKNDVTGGTTATTFSPNAVCTRAQAVTFLWRAAGCPEPAGTNSFTDVSADAYYAKAVAWAVEQGITNGTGGGKFSPDAVCTRAQVVAFLWRAEGSDTAGTANSFADVPTNAYYTDAVNWAVENSITGGTSATTFSPAANCTRAQIVTFLYRDMVE